MGYFPICVELAGKPVILLGNGRQIEEKINVLEPFGCRMIRLETLTEGDLDCCPMMVVVGDMPYDSAAKAAELCKARNIPVNVVDIPELCGFFFPALISQGDLTVAVSTAGKSPGTAVLLRNRIRGLIPDQAATILEWLGKLRLDLRGRNPEGYRPILSRITKQALEENRILTTEELDKIL